MKTENVSELQKTKTTPKWLIQLDSNQWMLKDDNQRFITVDVLMTIKTRTVKYDYLL